MHCVPMERGLSSPKRQGREGGCPPSLVLEPDPRVPYECGQGLLLSTCRKSFVRWIGVNPGPG